jgi:2-polyprenyl-6-methoxyphenol hydroxylase-like FAD-dependent oxidoreductase
MKLRDPSHDITILERKTSTASGLGVTYGADLLQELYRGDPELAREIERSSLCWRDQFAYLREEKVIDSGIEVYNISRSRLLSILAARARGLGVRIEYGREVAGLSQLPEADLIVAADGANSRIREAAGSFQTGVSVGRNKYIWLGTDRVFEEFGYIFAPSDSGWIWAYAYGINAQSSTFIVECAPETWTGLGFDTISTADTLPILDQLFSDQLAGRRLTCALGDGSTAQWLNFKTVTNQSWHSGKIVLVGDSARTAHFTIGMGTTLAVQDAIILADKLQEPSDLELVLQSYEQQRQTEISQLLVQARSSALWFENINRYIDLKPRQFGELLFARRHPVLQRLPPKFAYLLHHAATSALVRNKFGARIKPAAKAIYGQATKVG